MFYIDSQCTVTRRESSLVRSSRYSSSHFTFSRTLTAPPPDPLPRAKGSIRNEIITSMFETMLHVIVDSWEVISSPTENVALVDKRLSASSTVSVRKNKKQPGPRPTALLPRPLNIRPEPIHTIWWVGQDERAIVRFKNGNIYEGDISMKRMHGQGRFQWADGTVYMGHFDENMIIGQGKITWPNSTWYAGEFADNVRHGRGLFVDSRLQMCYYGDWRLGAKHGKGFMSYSSSFQNTYDGEWVQNMRQGMGAREYGARSVYYGDWVQNEIEGYGIMIWPHQDAFIGEWLNNEISGFGKYMWNVYKNKDLVLHTIQNYKGFFHHGLRCGLGILNLGFRNGYYYQGKFDNNLKYGPATCFIGEHTMGDEILFHDDVIVTSLKENFTSEAIDVTCHIEETIRNIGDGEYNTRVNILNKFLAKNRWLRTSLFKPIDESIKFSIRDDEEHDLNKSLKYYKFLLYGIYKHYATVRDITGRAKRQPSPVLIRLFLWQFYHDCQLEQKGLTQIEIDNMVAAHSHWHVKSAHDPFEKVHFWQFVHILVLLARHLYAIKTLPGPKPDNILQRAFTYFIQNDILPQCRNHKGNMMQYVDFVPLTPLYDLYASLGEPPTVRAFLCAARGVEHIYKGSVEIELVQAKTKCLPRGRNMFVFGNLVFQNDKRFFPPQSVFELECYEYDHHQNKLKLFNIGNLSSKIILNSFNTVFPNIYKDERVMNLDIEMTFFEFYEIFIACNKLSIAKSKEARPPRPSVVTTKTVKRSHR